MFCQAGGISMRRARGNSTPPVVSNSSMLSRLEESEPEVLTRGTTLWRSGSRGESSLGVRARDQARLPSMVLISPLWASIRNGWARGQRGRVLVENRWWKTHIAVSRAGSFRSG